MSQEFDLKGNTLLVDDVQLEDGTKVSVVTDNLPTFAAAVANPGTAASTPAAFNKVLKATIGGVDYYIGLYTSNA